MFKLVQSEVPQIYFCAILEFTLSDLTPIVKESQRK